VTRSTAQSESALAGPLSKRERECLVLLARGLKIDELARVLGTSSRTTEKQIASARRKLGASTREQAVVTALLNGLLAPRPTPRRRRLAEIPQLMGAVGDR